MNKSKIYSSFGKHYALRDDLKNVENYFFYEYIGELSDISKPDNLVNGIFVVIEPNEITFKKIKIYSSDPGSNTGFTDLLIIPRNTNYNSFAEIQNQLIRNKNKKDNKDIPFEGILTAFIEDLYLHNYFRECGDVIAVKAAIEYVPLLQGIVYGLLFNHYQQALRSAGIKAGDGKEENDDRKNILNKFEDAYLNYSRFLANPANEKLFLPEGWFVRDGKQQEIDASLYNTEKEFIEVKKKEEDSENPFLFNPVNIRMILKRYGVVNVLRLNLPVWYVNTFIGSLILLISFILFDVMEYNFTQGDNLKNSHSDLHSLLYLGLYISVLLFAVLTLSTFIILFCKLKLKVIPGIFLPRMVLAIISGWIVFLTGEEMLKIDINIDGSLLLIVLGAVVFVTLIFMIFEINNYAPAMGWKRVLSRSLVVCALGFIVSYTFGFWVMTHITQKFMSINSFLVDGSNITGDLKERVSFVKTAVEKLTDIKKENSNRTMPVTWIDSLTMPANCLDSIPTEKNCRDSFNSFIHMPARSLLKNRDSFLMKPFMDSLPRSLAKMQKIKKHYDNLQSKKIFDEYLYANQVFEIKDRKFYARNYPLNSFNYSKGVVISTFPNMILARALIAMFIGIFFQLIIQDKSITEPI